MGMDAFGMSNDEQGFTLIEISIVLVIIGLLVGGVLAGKEMISAAQVRSQLTQLERYNAGVVTFREKYNALPGDMPQTIATQYNFVYPIGGRSGGAGRGDGNGIIQGLCYNSGYNNSGAGCIGGEQAFFWEDLTVNTHLIEGSFTTATDAPTGYAGTDPSLYMPRGKLNGSNVFITISTSNATGVNLINSTFSGFYWVLENISATQDQLAIVNPQILVKQAQMLDLKIDDGLPTSGIVQAIYVPASSSTLYAVPNASPATASSCYDSGTLKYAVSINNGNNATCALTIQGQF
jgi:prepilin-type N-terminal cleavage/methylation domain-containing protein